MEDDVKILYDGIAERYDSFYSDILSDHENGHVATMLAPVLLGKQVVDLGCGTGLLVSMLHSIMPPNKYTGIDISPRMVEVAKRKYPNYSFTVGDASEYLRKPEQGKVLISLFTSPNYLDPEAVKEALFGSNPYFFMFGPEGYSSRVLGQKGRVYDRNLGLIAPRNFQFSIYTIATNLL